MGDRVSGQPRGLLLLRRAGWAQLQDRVGDRTGHIGDELGQCG
jgi:hypothetical protein